MPTLCYWYQIACMIFGNGKSLEKARSIPHFDKTRKKYPVELDKRCLATWILKRSGFTLAEISATFLIPPRTIDRWYARGRRKMAGKSGVVSP